MKKIIDCQRLNQAQEKIRRSGKARGLKDFAQVGSDKSFFVGRDMRHFGH